MKINHSIEIKNLFSVYNEKQDNEFVALRNINHTFELGKIYFIIGKSGCGKSTLLSYFNGLSYPKYGSVNIGQYSLDSKNNLNNVIISNVCFSNDKINKLIDRKYSNYCIFECASDVDKHTLSIYLKSLNREIQIKKIKLLPKSFFNIKAKNKFFIVHLDGSLNFEIFKKTNSHNEILTEKVKVYNGKKNNNKKVKNYKDIRKKVGVVYQFPEYQLFKPNILDEVMFGPIHLGFDKDTAKENSIKILKYLSIPETYFDKSPFGLSGGQKRRVALSGVLASNPDFLVFDEPTAGLDPKGESEMLNIILESKKQGKTVFVVTHSMEQVLEIADEVIVMDEGKIVKAGTPYEIFTNDDIVNITSVLLPNTITFIKDLVSKDKKFEKLYEMKPRNAEELADCIFKIQNEKRGKRV